MKKLFFWICLLSFSFFATDAMANLSGNESANAESAKIAKVKENHPRPFKGTTTYLLGQGIGYGHATHMGFFTTVSSYNGTIGTDIMHASDGSDLYMEWTWNMEDNTGVWNITGGTDRFSDATGSGEWKGYFTSDFSLFIIDYTGTIYY